MKQSESETDKNILDLPSPSIVPDNTESTRVTTMDDIKGLDESLHSVSDVNCIDPDSDHSLGDMWSKWDDAGTPQLEVDEDFPEEIDPWAPSNDSHVDPSFPHHRL